MIILKHITLILSVSIFCYFWFSCDSGGPTSPQTVETNSVEHGEDVITNEVWESDKIHTIGSVISVNHAILKINPGTKVLFKKDAAICIMDSAGLIADGTNDSITFTSDVSEVETWKYIYFSDNALVDSCKLINCVLEYGGADSSRETIIFCDNAAPVITGCVINNSPSTGVTLYGDCRGIEFHDNTISNCDFVPVQTYASNVSSIGNNTYRDNGLNQIRIIEGSVTFNDTWKNPSVPYRMADGLKINNATLSFEPGVQLLFEYDEGATISEDGSLRAVGTPSERIIFTGSDIGRWKGIFFMNSANDINSQLIHCVVENGGQDGNLPANIVLENASPEISNCLIRQSIGYGVYISGKIILGKFNNNVITNNAFAPISISANGVSGLSPGYYSGNGMDVIEVRGGLFEEPITEDGYWDNLELPYRVSRVIQIQSSTLMLAPGITVQMAEGSGFDILVQGGLIADGSSQLIEIEGERPTLGIWNNIYFSNTANAKNCQLINCRISYGGGDINRPGMIFCDNISPTIRNCIIEYSQTWGIYLNGNAVIVDLPSNSFNGNGYGDYFKTP